MVAQAVGAIMSGQADTVVVFRSRNGRSGNRFGLSSDLARATGGGESMIEFYGPYGLLSPGQFFALRAAVAYVAERVQFGRKFVSFPAIKHRCADVAIAVDDARSAAIHAVSAVQEGGDALRSARGGSVRTGLPGGCQGERPSAWRGRFHVGTLRPLVFSACDQ
ncbi:acyl-CoA dehydrogenase family protein [Rhodococcus zopfii]